MKKKQLKLAKDVEEAIRVVSVIYGELDDYIHDYEDPQEEHELLSELIREANNLADLCRKLKYS